MDSADILLLSLYLGFAAIVFIIIICGIIKIYIRERDMKNWIKMIVKKENIKTIDPVIEKELYFRFKRELPSTAKHYADYEFEKFLFKIIENNTKRKVKDKTYYWK